MRSQVFLEVLILPVTSSNNFGVLGFNISITYKLGFSWEMCQQVANGIDRYNRKVKCYFCERSYLYVWEMAGIPVSLLTWFELTC